jgi:hypothetical protein
LSEDSKRPHASQAGSHLSQTTRVGPKRSSSENLGSKIVCGIMVIEDKRLRQTRGRKPAGLLNFGRAGYDTYNQPLFCSSCTHWILNHSRRLPIHPIYVLSCRLQNIILCHGFRRAPELIQVPVNSCKSQTSKLKEAERNREVHRVHFDSRNAQHPPTTSYWSSLHASGTGVVFIIVEESRSAFGRHVRVELTRMKNYISSVAESVKASR